jgi:hypothetical protein
MSGSDESIDKELAKIFDRRDSALVVFEEVLLVNICIRDRSGSKQQVKKWRYLETAAYILEDLIDYGNNKIQVIPLEIMG